MRSAFRDTSLFLIVTSANVQQFAEQRPETSEGQASIPVVATAALATQINY